MPRLWVKSSEKSFSGDFYILVSKCREIEEEVRARWGHTTALPKNKINK
jgi:hypothetical protein